jgi:hypothetical protein
VTGRQSITGGTEFTFDVYSSKQFGTVVYQGLRGVSVTGSVLGAPLNVGDRLTVLGFFSVNLKRALDALPTTANAPGTAWTVKDALEFFVFGKTTKTAVVASAKCG